MSATGCNFCCRFLQTRFIDVTYANSDQNVSGVHPFS